MKIGMISQWYEPETGSAAHPAAIARALSCRGHDVRVLTSFPSYPLGQIYPGYRMSWRAREQRDGVDVLRVPDLPSHDQSALRRALSLTTFAASATANVRWLREADVVLTYLTPATVGVAAWALERVSRVPYVLYVQDLWPETITASGFINHNGARQIVERGIHALLTHLYARAAGVVAISPTMTHTLARRGPAIPPISIPNWIDEDVFKPAAPGWVPELPLDRTWIMYAGGIGEVQALDHAVRALALLSSRRDIGLAFVGDGVARQGLETLASKLGVADRVLFLGNRPVTAMPVLMAEAAAQLVSLKDLPLFRGTIPSKIQAAMACAAPIICAVAGDAADLVQRTNCGLAVQPESVSALAEAFVSICDMPTGRRRALGDAGHTAYHEDLSSAAGAKKLEQVLENASGRRRR